MGVIAPSGRAAPAGNKATGHITAQKSRQKTAIAGLPPPLRCPLPRLQRVHKSSAGIPDRMGTFILQPDVHPFFESLLGSSWFAIFHEFMTDLKEGYRQQ